jgi:hypothetical protein
MSADGDAPLALHRALATMLREIADAPETARLATVDLPSLGSLLHAHRDRALELFSTFLDVGLAALPEPPDNPDAISLCIAGGLWETVRRYALERRLPELPDALPGMSYFCLSTFFGMDEALRVSALPAGPRGHPWRSDRREHLPTNDASFAAERSIRVGWCPIIGVETPRTDPGPTSAS